MSAWMILLIVIGAALAAFTLLCCARILAKTGENGVKILIPFYGGFLFCKRTAEMGLLFWIQVVVAVIAGLAFLLSPLLGIFVLVNMLVFHFLFCINLSEAFGSGTGLAWLLFFVFPAGLAILAFGPAQLQRTQQERGEVLAEAV